MIACSFPHRGRCQVFEAAILPHRGEDLIDVKERGGRLAHVLFDCVYQPVERRPPQEHCGKVSTLTPRLDSRSDLILLKFGEHTVLTQEDCSVVIDNKEPFIVDRGVPEGL